MKTHFAATLVTLLASMNAAAQAPAPAAAEPQPFRTGTPLSATNEAGVATPMSANVKVYGSFRFAESCTFDPARNLILAMNAGIANTLQENDGYVSLINPDGSVHTSKWIGVTRDGLTLHHPLGSIGVAADGTAYISNTQPPQRIYKVTAAGEVSVFVDGEPLATPNGVAIDLDGNIVVVNIASSAVQTFNPAGELILTENSAEAGNDGVVVTEDGTKYTSSVRFGSVSRIRPGQAAEVIASGIPSAASMCYDSVQKQLVIPMNPNDALAFIPLE